MRGMARKKKTEPLYEVTFSVASGLPLAKRGCWASTFVVRYEGEVFGTLKIGRGSLMWTPKRKWKGRPITWAQFARKMEER